MAATHSPRVLHSRLGAPRSRSSLMAWVLWGLSAALLLGTLPLLVAVTDAASQTPTVFPFQLAQQLQQRLHLPFQFWFEVAITPVVVLAFSTLGAVIVTRHPENRIGWLFCAIGLLGIVEPFVAYYAFYTLWVQPGSLPGGLAAELDLGRVKWSACRVPAVRVSHRPTAVSSLETRGMVQRLCGGPAGFCGSFSSRSALELF